MARVSKRPMPVLIGADYKNVMAEATILENGDSVTVTIEASGSHGVRLIEFLKVTEPIAVSFVAVPVQPHNKTH